jgi:hypothetical protein
VSAQVVLTVLLLTAATALQQPATPTRADAAGALGPAGALPAPGGQLSLLQRAEAVLSASAVAGTVAGFGSGGPVRGGVASETATWPAVTGAAATEPALSAAAVAGAVAGFGPIRSDQTYPGGNRQPCRSSQDCAASTVCEQGACEVRLRRGAQPATPCNRAFLDPASEQRRLCSSLVRACAGDRYCWSRRATGRASSSRPAARGSSGPARGGARQSSAV